MKTFDYVESTSAAHMAGSDAMLSGVDRLIAVWDGKPGRGYGGTADIADLAHDRDIPVRVIWPAGANRD